MLTDEQIAARIAGQTIPQLFLQTVKDRPNAIALRSKQGDQWEEISWAQYADRAARIAAALSSLGVKPGDRVAMLLRNRPEFHIADIAILLCGATPISLYNSSSAEQIEYLINHSAASVVIVEDIGFLEKVLTVRPQLPNLQHVVIVDDPTNERQTNVHIWSDLLQNDPVELEQAAQIAKPEDLVTIIYTSGTTGPPKGVMLDHQNILWTVQSLLTAIGFEPWGYRLVSYLPMAHVAERVVSHYLGLSYRFEVTTCPEPSKIAEYLRPVKPQLLFAVPRIWEKAYATILGMVGQDKERKTALDNAIAVGFEASEYRARDEKLPADLERRYYEADAGVLGLWRGLMGMDELVIAVSGAAPIPFEIFKFFRALGVPLSEVYGLSETCGPLTWEPFRVKAGTVGPPIPGLNVRLGKDGEVCCQGGNIFRGYLNDPEKTAEVLDAQAWFHTGDIGVFDEDNYLRIVDRKKELIITAGGKNISPGNLEAALKALPLIGNACVVGDGKPFVGALIALDAEVASTWANSHGIGKAKLMELSTHPDLVAEVEAGVAQINKQFAQTEQIRKVKVLDHEWLPDSDVLTPTMKVKRRAVKEKYAQEIESLYAKP